MALSNKQQVFIENYLTCWNATESARRAGYAYPNVEGPKNLVNPSIKAQIQTRLEELKMSANEVLTRLAAHARSNIADYALINDNQDLSNLGDSAQVIKKFKRKKTKTKSGDEYEELELELYDAQSALEKLGRHHRLFADSVELSGPGGKPLEFTEVVVELPDDTLEN